jgi:hypothetical protein
VSALQECVTYDNTGDKNKVILALRKGTLGSRVQSHLEIMLMKERDKKMEWIQQIHPKVGPLTTIHSRQFAALVRPL